MHSNSYNLSIAELSKIEGTGGLSVSVKDGKLEDLKFTISEYKRFYTQAIEGKDVMMIPQLTARICGTCSNAHLLCAIKAIEQGLGVVVSEQTKTLRKLLNYGLMIRDHALHLYVFVLPDLLGVDNLLEIDEKDEYQHQLLHDTFDVKAAGNAIGKVVGGRSVHAPYLMPGGFMELPHQDSLAGLVEQLEKVRPAVLRLIDVFLKCDFSFIRPTEYVALLDEDYTFLGGDVYAGAGDIIKEGKLGEYLEHVVIPYSQASGYRFKGTTHMVGALARMNLAKDRLHINTKRDAISALAVFPSHNVYHNNLAQAIEILHSIDRSLDILKTLTVVPEKPVHVVHKAAVGVGAVEAPRGTLFYSLTMNDAGKVTKGEIVVPTGQNQIGIEKSLGEYFTNNLEQPQDVLAHEAEKIVRAYDPCISCASHFLTVSWR